MDSVVPQKKIELPKNELIRAKLDKETLRQTDEAKANLQLEPIEAQVREETAREIFDWFREFAIHGGKIPISEVLEVMRTHSKYAKYLPQEKKNEH